MFYDEDLSNLSKWFKANVLDYPDLDYDNHSLTTNVTINEASPNPDSDPDKTKKVDLTTGETEDEQEQSLIEFIIGINDLN